MKKTMSEAIPGESLNLLLGSIPVKNGDKDAKNLKIKLKINILQAFKRKIRHYEQDFVSAELEWFGKLRQRHGLDRSLEAVTAKTTAFAPIRAFKHFGNCQPDKTCICLLVLIKRNRQYGKTGAHPAFWKFLRRSLQQDCRKLFKPYFEQNSVRILLPFADVGAAATRHFRTLSKSATARILTREYLITKYTGSRGKAGASDGPRRIFGKDKGNVKWQKIVWQTGELGKVDLGGGGTVAQFLANLT